MLADLLGGRLLFSLSTPIPQCFPNGCVTKYFQTGVTGQEKCFLLLDVNLPKGDGGEKHSCPGLRTVHGGGTAGRRRHRY